jgi:molybdenum cofactor cytidylyltransferase
MICAIVLAAGRSRRMGSQKLLLPFAGTTVIGHVVDQLLASAVDRTCVVAGHQAERIAAELAGRRVEVVVNSAYQSGMLSSVRCGLRALPPQCRAVLVALGDQPSITSALVDEMLRAFAAGGRDILVPVHQGRRGHPILLSLRFRDEVLSRYDDVGLRGLLRAHPDDVLELPAASDAILWDMDRPEDYQRQLRAPPPGARPPGGGPRRPRRRR